MMGIGYRQLVRVLRGELGPEEARERIKRDTRSYAKRQLTWFQNQEQVQWVEARGAGGAIRDAIQELLDRV
jgi:tRNA dimethylallyltransferase